MSGDTFRPPHIANKLFMMETSEFGRHVESCQKSIVHIHRTQIRSNLQKLARYDLQTKLNKCVKLIQNRK